MGNCLGTSINSGCFTLPQLATTGQHTTDIGISWRYQPCPNPVPKDGFSWEPLINQYWLIWGLLQNPVAEPYRNIHISFQTMAPRITWFHTWFFSQSSVGEKATNRWNIRFSRGISRKGHDVWKIFLVPTYKTQTLFPATSDEDKPCVLQLCWTLKNSVFLFFWGSIGASFQDFNWFHPCPKNAM